MSTVSLLEFEPLLESVKNWGCWGPDDELGALNYITPAKVGEAAALVRTGLRTSMVIATNKVPWIDGSKVRFGLDRLGIAA